jgi:hypothetical protein
MRADGRAVAVAVADMAVCWLSEGRAGGKERERREVGFFKRNAGKLFALASKEGRGGREADGVPVCVFVCVCVKGRSAGDR